MLTYTISQCTSSLYRKSHRFFYLVFSNLYVQLFRHVFYLYATARRPRMRRKKIKSKLVTNTPEKMELEKVQQEKEDRLKRN